MVKVQRVYSAVSDRIRSSIRRKSVAPGTVLLEAPLAKLFGSSRSPVKQALALLEAEGLLTRFAGRGYIVGPANGPIRRRPITSAMLGMSQDASKSLRLPTWKTIYDRIERELIQRSIFGQFRINELELSRFYKIGRTVAHEVLMQIQSTGIITRRDRAQWLTVPLDHKRINDLFDLRILLEPQLCRSAAQRIPEAQIAEMRDRLLAGAEKYPEVDPEAMDNLESDVHMRMLQYGTNVEFFEALRRTRCILISGKHILGHALPYPQRTDFFFNEHLDILDALRRRDGSRASKSLITHLEQSRERVIERLAGFRERHRTKAISFITTA